MITPRNVSAALLLYSIASPALAVHGSTQPLPAADPAAARAAVADPAALSWVRVDMANLRAGATTDSRIVCQVAQNTAVLEKARRGDWVSVEVKPKGPKGWVFSPLLAASEQAPTPASLTAADAVPRSVRAAPPMAPGPTPARPAGSVGSRWVAITDGLTLRVMPQPDAITVATIPLGVELSVLEARGDWSLVMLTDSGATGWVSAQALQSTDVVAVGAAMFLKRTQLDAPAKSGAPLSAPRPTSQ